MARFALRSIAIAVVALASCAGLPTGSASADVDESADIQLSAAFAKPAYPHDEGTISATLTVHNAGPAPAARVHLGYWQGNVLGDPSQWGDLHYTGPGVRLEPGESIELELSGPLAPHLVHTGQALFGIEAWAVDIVEPNPDNNRVMINAPITMARGNLTGTVYADRDGDGALDPGERMQGVIVVASGGVPYGQFVQTTKADGRFEFKDLPAGEYGVTYSVPGGWTADGTRVVVSSAEHPDLLVRATRPAATLTASVAFTKSSYAVGDEAHLTVVLTNTGTRALTGVTALCTGAGFGFEIDSSPPGWGELSYLGPGATIGAGETRTFDVWSVVPEGAFTYGFVGAFCIFGSPPEAAGNPETRAKAKVPGGIGTAGGQLIHDRNSDGKYDGDGVPNTKIVLLDEDSHAVVARSTTDANGRFVFADVPAGEYQLAVVGPWKVVSGADYPLQVLAGRDNRDAVQLIVVPGAVQPDPDAPPSTTPAPQGAVPPAGSGTTSRLAATGPDDVPELTITGLASLITGLVLVLVRRRPRTGRAA